MIILGFDLSTKYIGWATTDGDGQRIDSGEVKLNGKMLDDRIIEATAVTADFCAGHVDIIATESPFVGRNGKTTMALGKLCGVLWANVILCTNKTPVECTTSEVKKAMTGSGKADKALMMQMARSRYGLETVGEHEADALGVCLAAIAKIRRLELEALA